jgi:O-antigen ligase
VIATTVPGAGVLAAAALGALVVIAGLTLVMRRDARVFPVLAVIALPFRLPISAGGRTVNLLLPLYAVVAAGALAHLLPRLREARGRRVPRPWRAGGRGVPRPWQTGGRDDAAGGSATAYRDGPPPMLLDWLLLGSIALYTLQIAYSSDPSKGLQNLVFFYIPFALLYMLMREAPWTPRLVLRCLGAAVVLAVLFAGLGDVEYLRKSLFLNPKVVAANEYDNYFRVNSLFFDPSIYGRFLALVMIAVTTVVLWVRPEGHAQMAHGRRGRREQVVGAVVLAWLMVGLVTSFSQSSIAALLLGLAVLAAWRWDARGTVYVAAALAAIAAVAVLLAPSSLHFGLKGSGGSANNATSGRAKLISGGLRLFADRPLTGYGAGAFETEYKRHGGGTAQNATSASHTIPVTVAAEQGILGLGLYVALVVAALLTLFRGAGRSPPRIAIAACFAALVLHTWVYADFLEDPMTWTLLGIGVALAAMREGISGERTRPLSAGSPPLPVTAPE